MLNSRKIEDLHPHVQTLAKEFLAQAEADPWMILNAIDVLLTSTKRDFEAQEYLYAQGRSRPGPVVTWAHAGESMHNYGLAIDVVPTRAGKPVWGTAGNGIDEDPTDDQTDDLEVWQRLGEIGEAIGFEWAGRWPKGPKGKREFPHLQWTGGLTLAQLKAGEVPLVELA